MRIAIDARELGGQPTGVGRYLAEIARVWRTLPAAAGHEIIWCSNEAIEQPLLDRQGWRVAVRAGGSLYWEQIAFPGLARAAGADVLFAPAYSGPMTGSMPLVVSIHDVSFAAHPEWFRLREGLRRRTLTRAAARRAATVLTLTEFSRREIHDHLGVPLERIRVAAPGPSGLPAQTAGGLRQETVLMVGSIFNRRHVPELVRGFARVAATHPSARLAIVGDNRTHPHVDIEAVRQASGMANRITVHAYVTDDVLTRLYAEARAFAYLSSYEGFGIPPLDALVHGVPPVLLDTEVAHEVFGDAALYVARPEPNLVAGALERALYNEPTRAAVLTAAPEVVGRYAWTTCATAVLAALEQAAAEQRRAFQRH
ncbi:MAG: glycosyltransferase family 1 protein [Vicinamibacterales bacterium]